MKQKSSKNLNDRKTKKTRKKSYNPVRKREAAVLTTVRKFRPEWKQLCSRLEYKDSEKRQ